jgi:hypothetical protein
MALNWEMVNGFPIGACEITPENMEDVIVETGAAYYPGRLDTIVLKLDDDNIAELVAGDWVFPYGDGNWWWIPKEDFERVWHRVQA